MSAEYSRAIDAHGIISGGVWLELPQMLYSQTGDFYRTVTTPEELLDFLREHRATPGAFFDVEAVWEYYCEVPGNRLYTAFMPENRHDTETRQMLHEGFVLY